MNKRRNTKYRFMVPAFAALLYRLLQSKIYSSFSFDKRERRITQRGSGRRWSFFLNHRGTKTQHNTEGCFCISAERQPSLRSTKAFMACEESKPAMIQPAYTNTNFKSAIINHNFFFLLIILFIFSSCEKVIDINLKEADRQVVIEGTVSRGEGNSPEVRISETKAFEDSNGFNGVSGAVVTIQVNNGAAYLLYEGEKGVYRTGMFYGEFDSTYTLTVALNGKTYTAVSHLPAQEVTLDSLWAEGLVFGGNTNIAIYPKYNDPKGLGNSYNLVEYRNDTLVKKAFPQNDEFSDGNTVTRPLINPDSKLERGDFIMVWLQCIDAEMYKYWYSLDAAATGNNQSATPTNPVSNITGGALGYFSAYSATQYSFRIP